MSREEEERRRLKRRRRRRGGKVEGKKPHRRLDRRARGGSLDAGERAGETKPTKPLAEARNPLDPMARKRGGEVAFRTHSGGVSAAGRREAQHEGDTMPGGRFPIRNAQDLSNAKHDLGRAKGDKSAVRRWINKRAKELGEPGLGG